MIEGLKRTQRRDVGHWVRSAVGITVGLGVVAGLAACGGSDGSTSSATAAAATTASRDYKIAQVVTLDPPNGFIAGLRCGVKQAAQANGLSVEVQGPSKYDGAEEVKVLNAVVASRPDAIIVDAADPKILSAPIASAARSGIKMVGINALPTDTSSLSGGVITDNEQGGQLAAQGLIEAVGGTGKVAIIDLLPGQAGVSAGAGRDSGFEDVVKAAPGIDYLGRQYTGNDPVKAAQVTSGLLTRHPDLAGIYLPAPVDSAGVLNALRSAGKLGKVKVVAYDPREDLIEEMRAGHLHGLVAQDLRQEGKLALEYAVQALDGEQPPKDTVLPNVYLSPEDLDDPSKQQYLYKGC